MVPRHCYQLVWEIPGWRSSDSTATVRVLFAYSRDSCKAQAEVIASSLLRQDLNSDGEIVSDLYFRMHISMSPLSYFFVKPSEVT